MNSVLVTGGSGFIGSEIIKHLSWKKINAKNYDLANGHNLHDVESLKRHIKNCDLVIHIAAQANFIKMEGLEGALDGIKTNVSGTYNIAHFCAKYNKPLIYGSTVCVYGNIRGIGDENNTLLNPSDVYAYSKLAGENIILGYAKTFNLNYVILRFATTYGPGMRPELAVYRFIESALNNKPIFIHGDGRQTRTQTHVYDIAAGTVKAAEKFNKIKNNIINLSASEKISAKQMAIDIIKRTNSKSKIVYVDQRINQTFKEEFNTSKARKLLNWSPVYSWNRGLDNTIQWITSLKGDRSQQPYS